MPLALSVVSSILAASRERTDTGDLTIEDVLLAFFPGGLIDRILNEQYRAVVKCRNIQKHAEHVADIGLPFHNLGNLSGAQDRGFYTTPQPES